MTLEGPHPGDQVANGRVLRGFNAADAFCRKSAEFALGYVAVTVAGAAAWQVGVLNAAISMGFLVLGIPIGVLVERYRLPAGLVAVGVMRSATLAITAVLAWQAVPHLVYVLIAAGAVVSVVSTWCEAAQFKIASLVTSDGSRARMAGWLQAADLSAAICAPAAMIAVIGWFSAAPTLAGLAALSAVAAALPLLFRKLSSTSTTAVPEPETPSGVKQTLRQFGNQAAHGWSVLVRDKPVYRLSLAGAATNMALAVFASVDLIVLLRHFQVSPWQLGCYTVVGAVSGIGAAMVAGRMTFGMASYPLARWSYALTPITAIPTACAFMFPQWAIVFWCLQAAVWSVVVTYANVHSMSFAMSRFAPDVLARVGATKRTITMGLVPVGGILGGALASGLGFAAAFGVWLVLLLLGAIIITLPAPEHQAA